MLSLHHNTRKNTSHNRLVIGTEPPLCLGLWITLVGGITLMGALICSGCDSSEPNREGDQDLSVMSDSDQGLNQPMSDAEGMDIEQMNCESTRPPIVMAHGFLAAGDTSACN